jgi:ECF-type riboflavin transporter, S component
LAKQPSKSSIDVSDARILRARTLKGARIVMLTAIAVSCGYLLIAVPNVELISATVALSGLMLGVTGGLLVGILSMAIFSALNVLGIPYLPIWIAQMLGMGITGAIFGLARKRIDLNNLRKAIVPLVILGILSTTVYDLLTNLSFPIAISAPLHTWWGYIVAGVPFAITHLISNILVFMFIVPVVFSRVGSRYSL